MNRMIGALAGKLAEGGGKALPAPRTVSAEAVRELATQLNGKTWRVVKAKLEKLADVNATC